VCWTARKKAMLMVLTMETNLAQMTEMYKELGHRNVMLVLFSFNIYETIITRGFHSMFMIAAKMLVQHLK
jgi:hypothetical protein